MSQETFDKYIRDGMQVLDLHPDNVDTETKAVDMISSILHAVDAATGGDPYLESNPAGLLERALESYKGDFEEVEQGYTAHLAVDLTASGAGEAWAKARAVVAAMGDGMIGSVGFITNEQGDEVNEEEPAGAPPAAEIPLSAHALSKIEAAWYSHTKGELNLTEEPDPKDVALVNAMWTCARGYVDTFDTEQYGDGGRELDSVDDDEIARRIAESLALLQWGMPS